MGRSAAFQRLARSLRIARFCDREGLSVHLEHWASNPLTKGSYTCNAPGYFTTIADNEAKPVGNLFFAGEHTSSFYDRERPRPHHPAFAARGPTE